MNIAVEHGSGKGNHPSNGSMSALVTGLASPASCRKLWQPDLKDCIWCVSKLVISEGNLIFHGQLGVIFRHAQISAAVAEFHHLLVTQKDRRSELSELSVCEGGNFKVTDLTGRD